MTNKSGKEVKLKASERLSILEQQTFQFMKRLGELETIMFAHSRENDMLKEALKLMNEKQEAILHLSRNNASLSDNNINNAITEMRVSELKERVDKMVRDNKIESTEECSEDSILVGRELDKEGNVVNPRIQFQVSRLKPEQKERFVGKKVGDLVVSEGDRLDIEIEELYEAKIEEVEKVEKVEVEQKTETKEVEAEQQVAQE